MTLIQDVRFALRQLKKTPGFTIASPMPACTSAPRITIATTERRSAPSAIGIPAAMLAVRAISAQLYEITDVGAGVLLFAVGTLAAAAACVAGIIQARRAASIDPIRALRTE